MKHGEPELLSDIWARCLECYEEGGPRRCQEKACLLRGKEVVANATVPENNR